MELEVKQNEIETGKTNQQTSLQEKALLNIDEICAYLGIGKTKARELLHDRRNGFTVRIGNRLYAHRKKLEKWIDAQIL